MNKNDDLLSKIVSLAKRRGFIFQSSEIYGGLKSAYDYGPLGVELKRNIANQWWRTMVLEREDVVGLDAAIMMHPKVWETSGHVSGFSDPLVDCLNCKERFRADKAPQLPVGTAVTYRQGGKPNGKEISSVVGERGYVCPNCNSTELSDERQFNLMFRTSIGPIDPVDSFINEIAEKKLSRQELREKYEELLSKSVIYLRPETAQGIFMQYLNVQQSLSMKIPFGIAQQGKAFRNEITTERFIFRTCEFEQMEMEYFVEPGTQRQWLEYWTSERIKWWQSFANNRDNFRLREHTPDELAHYADCCFDIEYRYPWGWDELEGVASRTDYDLSKHAAASGVKLSYFDQTRTNPDTGKPGWRYTPYVIEPASGLTRAVLMYLLDAYSEESGIDAQGREKTRTLLKLHPLLAPIKVAVLPLVKKDGLPDIARKIVEKFFKAGINASYDEQHSIGKRYSRHDEVGTPFCLTVDHQTSTDDTVTIRDRDTTRQERIPIDKALEVVKAKL
ncbi:MAG: glycine--tRNA ligase [Candidatus Dadabacteria bacterium]|nr:MAG: glycine--tRNA ligase [Candidatus Dadabacteria bacterium]